MKQRKQRRDKIARLISWGDWFTFFNILVVLAIGSLYIEAAEAPGSGLGVIYMLLNWLGHFAFLPFIVFIILIFPFCLIERAPPKLSNFPNPFVKYFFVLFCKFSIDF